MIKNLRNIAKALFSLLAFFTPIPIPDSLYLGAQIFSHLYLLPLVGIVRGLIVIVPLLMVSNLGVASPFLTAFMAIALHFMAQGLIHVDGFIDFSEAILAHRFGVDGYRVVKDRYRGSYAIAIFTIYTLGIFSFILSLIDLLELSALACLLLLIELWSTNTILILSYLGKEPPEGLGKMFKRCIKFLDLVLSTTLSAIATILTLYISTLNPHYANAIIISIFLSILISYTSSNKVLGFVNGDVLGFSSELFYLISLIVYWVFTWI